MSEVRTVESPVDETGKLRNAIQQYIQEIGQILDQIRKDQVEIERSRTRTRAMLDDLKARELC